ncbi:hypothetical protein ABG768_017697 [Culter alburnus]|uniref:RBR-type E3 ubiquitin transferase n=1 Tax=Culter alburnus TaxID=194366 RepID=A0AAW1YTS6_CULAL
MAQMEKQFTYFDKNIRLVLRPSDIDEFDDDPDVLRAELSCGHVASPDSLTDCCRAQLERGETELKCPICQKKWPYEEIRELAKLTLEERKYFEKTLGKRKIKTFVEFKDCPSCGMFVEREDVSNLSVECSICTTRTGRTYEFCWQCLKQWKGSRPRADQCDNEGCTKDLKLLKNCEMITLTSVKNIRVPSIRACPTCGTLIEHTTENCKNIECYNCGVEFCFSCLKITTECLKTSTHFSECSDGVAPRQTSIPWNTI